MGVTLSLDLTVVCVIFDTDTQQTFLSGLIRPVIMEVHLFKPPFLRALFIPAGKSNGYWLSAEQSTYFEGEKLNVKSCCSGLTGDMRSFKSRPSLLQTRSDTPGVNNNIINDLIPGVVQAASLPRLAAKLD